MENQQTKIIQLLQENNELLRNMVEKGVFKRQKEMSGEGLIVMFIILVVVLFIAAVIGFIGEKCKKRR